MVFGLFSRKPTQNLEPPVEEQQLRTPSPSTIQRDASPFPLVEESGTVLDQSDLYNLIRSVPAKTLHDYSLSRLQPSSPAPTADGSLPPQILAGLTAFFSSLTPPPTLHCVRCHKFYMDVENDDRACRVSHDDDSAEVDRHETLWECCGKTVEGDGDMGPPDGWCYEGMHTTDTKRARFRADSTLYDDKLVSCSVLRCHEPPNSSPRSTRSTKSRRARVTSPSKLYRTTTASASPVRSNVTGKRRRSLEDDETADLPAIISNGHKGKDRASRLDESDEEDRGRARAPVKKRPRKSISSPSRTSETLVAERSDSRPRLPRQSTEILATALQNEASRDDASDMGPAGRTRSRSRSRVRPKSTSSFATFAAAMINNSAKASTPTPSSSKRNTSVSPTLTKPAPKSASKPPSKIASMNPAPNTTAHGRGSSIFSATSEQTDVSARARTPVSTASTPSTPKHSTERLPHRCGSRMSVVVEIPVSRYSSRSPAAPPPSKAPKSGAKPRNCTSDDIGNPLKGPVGNKGTPLLSQHLSQVVASSVDGEDMLYST
ncbi:hypothetical protein PC9H_004599 [Pleurotus ostreatus]|uniref:Uncharacterized protein n=1 Tax=Pleurotus ostreatus TaxID=5322 RepID=A0A8H6ZV03_PLEOS|nr:uncharacterized protein PC9H_004599 [Pleurotus ostreatus]KAF7432657.1 hypothetical protein PC9H_004599 [Pleurotus ostreatus]KAJ8698823.1 hypothetical protein PTI98_005490 [Pleurotus ostreatus]